jgi:hypothetical protein
MTIKGQREREREVLSASNDHEGHS